MFDHSEQKITALIFEASELKARYDFKAACQKITKALELSKISHNILGQIISLNRLADILAAMKQFRQAFDQLAEAELLCRKHHYNIELVLNQNLKGMILNEIGDSQKALEPLQYALAIQEHIFHTSTPDQDQQKFHKDLFHLHINLGFTYRRLCHFVQAMYHYEQAKEIAFHFSDETMKAIWCVHFGELTDIRGNKDEALKLYQQAAESFRKNNQKKAEATTLNNIASVLAEQANFSQAMAYVHDSLQLWQDINDPTGVIGCLKNEGDIYHSQGDTETALEKYQQALEYSQAYNLDYETATLASQMGLIYESRGDDKLSEDGRRNEYLTALKCFVIAEEKFRLKNTLLNLVSILSNKAAIYSKLRQLETARQEYDKALRLAQEIGSKHELAIVQNNLCRLYYQLGKFEVAHQFISESIDTFQQLNDVLGLTIAEANLGKLYWSLADSSKKNHLKEKNLKLAQAYFTTSLSKIESVRSRVFNIQKYKYLYFEKHFDIYESLVEIDIALKNYSEAFYLLEKSKARTLIDVLNESNVELSQDIAEEFKIRKKELEQGINDVITNINNIYYAPKTEIDTNKIENLLQRLYQNEQELNELEIKISSRHPRLATIMAPQIITLDKLQRTINDGTVFLEYFFGKFYVYVWLITRINVKFYRLKSSHQTRELLERYYNFISDTGISCSHENFEIGQQLFKCLLHDEDDRSILNEISSEVETIFIIPDKGLFKLPFEALVTDIQNQFANFLVDKGYKIAYLPSSTTYCLLQGRHELAKKSKKPLSLLALGDPIYPLDDIDYQPHQKRIFTSGKLEKSKVYVSKAEYLLHRIPNTSNEVRQIQAIFERHKCKPEKLKILLRQDANEQLIKQLNETGALKNFQYLHFACHGLLGLDIPWLKQAALVLSQHPGQKEDGFLKLSDIFNLRLDASLVVLSACQTGLGKEYKGEGLIGLTRGFIFAGAPRIISSLWSVADKETSDFMAKLYSNMIEVGDEPIRALYETKVKFKQENEHPFYWAPFIHIGI